MRKLKFDKDKAFLLFVTLVTGILFLISGSGSLSAFLSGIFLYLYLRLMYFLWRLILRLCKLWF